MGAIVDDNQLQRVLGYIESGQDEGRDRGPWRSTGA